jgi:WS/DGAT/MGAT family acyltransferase
MASGDAAWLHMDRPTNELVVNAVLWFDEPLAEDVLREAIEKRLVDTYARFGQRVEDTGTAAWWVDDPDFDPMSHVRRERLSGGGDLADLHQHVTCIVAEPLDPARPLWRIHVVDGFLGGTALVARIHHCIADGVALFRVLLSLSDEAQGDGPDDVTRSLVSARARSLPARVRSAAVAGVRVGRALAELVGLPPDRRTPLRQPLGADKSVVWSAPIPVTHLRAASRARGATINDLLLASLSAALRAHLAAAGGPVRNVRVVLPVNLRPIEPGPVDLGNRFGLVFLRLPVTVPGLADRVRIIRRRTAALKRSATAPVALGILQVAGHGSTRLIRLLITVFSAKASAVVTNVPGPTAALHLGGNRLAGVVAWPPQSGSLGLGISLISYAGQAVVGVMADDGLVPDPAGLLEAVCAELGSPSGARR